MFGVVGYPAQGLYKSVQSLRSKPAMKAIKHGRAAQLEMAKGRETSGQDNMDLYAVQAFGRYVK